VTADTIVCELWRGESDSYRRLELLRPDPNVGGIKRWCASDVCLSDVCLSRTSGLSRK